MAVVREIKPMNPFDHLPDLRKGMNLTPKEQELWKVACAEIERYDTWARQRNKQRLDLGNGADVIVAKAREALAELERERDKARKSDAFHIEACAAHQNHIDELQRERDSAQAACAAMRKMLQVVYDWCVTENPSDISGDEVKRLLDSTDCGKDLLERLERKDAALRSVLDYGTLAGFDKDILREALK